MIEVRTATYGPGIDQSQYAKLVSHIIIILITCIVHVIIISMVMYGVVAVISIILVVARATPNAETLIWI